MDYDHAFFADESGITQDQFIVVGGIAVGRDAYVDVLDRIQAFRKQHSMGSELKWTKITNQKLPEYAALVDLFFSLLSEEMVAFHALIFDGHLPFKPEHKGNRMDGRLTDIYCALILDPFIKNYGDSESLFICLDNRISRISLQNTRSRINAIASQRYGYQNPIKELVSRDSHHDNLLQLNDVILGAVCAIQNRRHLAPDARQAKKEIAEIVLHKSGHQSFGRENMSEMARFTIAHMTPPETD